jgi:hypothetical protein
MHTRDYVVFAEAIKEEREMIDPLTPESTPTDIAHTVGQLAGIEKIARRAAQIFRADNERFNVDQFLTAAGIQ